MSNNIIHLNEEAIKNQLGELVRNTVEETLNNLLDQEADRITNAKRYEGQAKDWIPVPGIIKESCLQKQGE